MMEIARGKLVLIRVHEPGDFHDETLWGLDRAVTSLDPPAGETLNPHPYAIDTLDGFHIGVCNLYDHDVTFSSIQLGIRIGNKDYWNRGYGTEAVELLTLHAFISFGVTRVWLKVLPENVRAVRCYEKCGFIAAGMLALSGYDFVVMEKLL